MTRQALVTGSEGFLGRHWTWALAHRGWNVLGLDVRTGQDCRTWFVRDDFDTRFDLVVHCAGVVGGRRSIEHAPLEVAASLGIDAAMFAWAARTRQPTVWYPSSSAAYPLDLQTEQGHRPLREDDLDLDAVRAPDSSYGWVKVTGERLARHARDAGVRVVVVRPFSGYAADQGLEYPFPTYLERARRRDDPFDVWGDGRQTRDFIHVSDLIEASLVLIELGGQDDAAVNLGTGRATSFLELARMCCEAAGYEPEIRTLPEEPVGARHRVADSDLMRSYWEPKVELEDAVHQALVWEGAR